jgi:ABC-type phosphonate transport system ATPase subunit
MKLEVLRVLFFCFIQARLAFCKFMVKPSTLLVLDEPTNHLDIPSKEMLEVWSFPYFFPFLLHFILL